MTCSYRHRLPGRKFVPQRECFSETRQQRLKVPGRHDDLDVLPHHALIAPPKQPLRPRVPCSDDAVLIEFEHRVKSYFKNRKYPLFRVRIGFVRAVVGDFVFEHSRIHAGLLHLHRQNRVFCIVKCDWARAALVGPRSPLRCGQSPRGPKTLDDRQVTTVSAWNNSLPSRRDLVRKRRATPARGMAFLPINLVNVAFFYPNIATLFPMSLSTRSTNYRRRVFPIQLDLQSGQCRHTCEPDVRFHWVAIVVPCWLLDVPTCNTTGTAVPTWAEDGI
jgi:hypothetical protein